MALSQDLLDFYSGIGAPTNKSGVGANADRFNPEFATRLQALIKAAEAATGTSVKIREGYRSPEIQAQYRANYKNAPITYGGKTYYPSTNPLDLGHQAAPPGNSEHQLGMAADMEANAASDWMRAHASEFGLSHLGSSDPYHFEIPPTEYKSALAGTPLQPFGNTALGAATKMAGEGPAKLNALGYANAVPPPLKSSMAGLTDAASGVRLPPNQTYAPYAIGPDNEAALNAQGLSPSLAAGLGALDDPRTASLLAPSAQPGQSIIERSPPIVGQSQIDRGALYALPPAVPGQSQIDRGAPYALPPPVPNNSLIALPPVPPYRAPVAAPPVQTGKLPSGAVVPIGVPVPHTDSDGKTTYTTFIAGPNGTAVPGPHTYPPLIDASKPGTIAHGIATGMLDQAGKAVGQKLNDAGNAINNTVDQVKTNAGNFLGSALGGLGNLFGGSPNVPAVPPPPISNWGDTLPKVPASSPTPASSWGASLPPPVPIPYMTPTPAPVTTTGNVAGMGAVGGDIANPAYTAWQKQMDAYTAAANNPGAIPYSGFGDPNHLTGVPVHPGPPPPKTIRAPAQSAQPQQAAPPVTFKGTSSGQTYEAGKVYSNSNGQFMATTDGKFVPVGTTKAQGTPKATNSNDAYNAAQAAFYSGVPKAL